MKKIAPLLLLLLPLWSVAQIVNIEDQRITGTNDTTRWYGLLRFGANLVKNREQVLSLNATGQVQYKKDKSLLLLLLDARFLRAGSKNFNNKGFSHLRYNYSLTDKTTLEAFAQTQYNRLLLIELRSLAGAGLRFRLFKDQSGKNRIYAGTAYLAEHTRFIDIENPQVWQRWSSYLSFTFRPGKNIKLVGTTYYQPQIGDFSNYRLSSEARFNFPISRKLNFSLDFSYSIDQSLPETAPVDIYSWTNSLTWRFN